MCFKYIAFPHFCSNSPNTLQGNAEAVVREIIIIP